MKFTVFSSDKGEEWDQIIADLGGSVFHSDRWAPFVIDAYGGVRFFRLLLSNDDGKPLGAALAFISSSKFGIGNLLWTEAVPLVKGGSENTIRQFLKYLRKFSMKYGIHVIKIGSFGHSCLPESLQDEEYILSKRLEFIVRLKDRQEDDIFSNLNPTKRNAVRSAGKKGVIVREESDLEGLSALLCVQQDSAQRIMKRGGPDIAYEGSIKDHSAYPVINNGAMRLFVARKENVPVSAIACSYFSGKAYQVLAGHSQEGFKLQSGVLALWHATKTFLSEGASEFNLGGCSADASLVGSPEHGVYKFKRMFGAECVECIGGVNVIRPHALAVTNLIRKVMGRPPLI